MGPGGEDAVVPPKTPYVQPLLVSRISCAMVCLFGVLAAWSGDFPTLGQIAATAAGLWLAWRCLRVGVLVMPTTVVVRGYFWDRQVRRGSVVDVTAFPSVMWCDDDGRERKTPVIALMENPRGLPAIERRHRSRAEELRRLLVRGGGTLGRRRRRRR